jgi:hypothetical protein
MTPLDQLKEIAKKATPGPWFAREPSVHGNWVVENTIGMWIDVPQGESTARHIANCNPKTVLTLIECLEMAIKELKFYGDRRTYDAGERIESKLKELHHDE